MAQRRILDELDHARARVAAALALDAKPWRHWRAFYAVLLPFFTIYRCVGLSAMLEKYASAYERTAATKAKVLVLGLSEDVVLVTLVLVALSAADFVAGPTSAWARVVGRQQVKIQEYKHDDELLASTEPRGSNAEGKRRLVETKTARWAAVLLSLAVALRRLLRFALHAVVVVYAVATFATDILLLRIRSMRFTYEFVTMYLREINFATGFSVDPEEVSMAKQTIAVSLVIALSLLFVDLVWFDFTQWHLARLVQRRSRMQRKSEVQYEKVKDTPREAVSSHLEEGTHTRTSSSHRSVHDDTVGWRDDETFEALDESPSRPRPKRIRWVRVAQAVGVPVGLCTVLCLLLLVIAHAVPAAVSACGLNDSLNELFRTTFKLEFLPGLGNGKLKSASVYIDSTTEEYELFRDDVLYRKTTGFKGPLAFDVKVNASDPPNVLVVVVESFRYQDSLYIVGNRSAALLKKQHNITLTPQFDRWAKRGIAFRNFWSSWPTSRSLESILFGQVPYDHVTSTGTSGGKKGVKLNGMPQLFKAKGYETVFTSGARIQYDQWDHFLPSHGFEQIVTYPEFVWFAEHTKNVTAWDWDQGDERFGWGVHDDLSFEILGDLLINKTAKQRERVARGEPKQPFFLNHYTISSHTPFRDAPTWYNKLNISYLQPMWEGEDNENDVRRYVKLRHFTDMELGKFLDRMQAKGVLNDTIVVVVGDHGQSPEIGLSSPEIDQIATTRVAATLIAEGRLANYSGMVLNDATEHFDLLNTLADIVGVPDGGFLQSGVGRSLKRAFPPGVDRHVWTNNPQLTLAVVKGHRRLRFDRVFSMMELFDAEQDPREELDLLSTVGAAERRAWETLRDQGRQLSRYFRVRWDGKCISQVDC